MIIAPTQALRQAAAMIRKIGKTDPAKAASILAMFTDEDLEEIARCWQTYARPKQLRPIGCTLWTNTSGRGTGKTRGGAEDQLDIAEDWGAALRGALVSKSIGDVRDVMIEGPSGLIACARRRGYKVEYIANRGIVRHPSGAIWYVMSAESADFGRGPNLNCWWADEVSAWPKGALAKFRAFLLAVRLPAPTESHKPLGLITMTPKPNEISRWVLRSKEMRERPGHVITCEPTIANAANVDYEDMLAYAGGEGSRFALQELQGVLLDDIGKVFRPEEIHAARVANVADACVRRVVSLDPSININEDSDACGVLVIGSDQNTQRPEVWVIADYTVQGARWSQWARQAVMAYVAHECDAIVAEINQGGHGIIEAIETAATEISEELGYYVSPRVVPVFARESKKARAEPLGPLYEQGRVHHVGYFPALELEMTEWVPGAKSPNRMDALTQGVAHLVWGERKSPTFGGVYYGDGNGIAA